MASKTLTRKVLLLVVDALLITGALLVALRVATRPGYFDELVFGDTWYFVLPVIVFLLAVYFVQGYHLEEIVTPWKGLSAMVLAAGAGGVATGFLFFVLPGAPEFSARALVVAALLIVLLLWLARIVYGRALVSRSLKENLLVVGTDPSALEVVTLLAERAHSPYHVAGILAPRPRALSGTLPLVTLAELPALVRAGKVDTIVLGTQGSADDRLVRAVVTLKRRGIHVRELTDLYEELTGMTPVQHVGQLNMLFANLGQRSEFRRYGEEFVNRGLGLFFLLISAPLWPIIIIAQQLTSRGPIFVEKTERVGLWGRPFRFYKFRTMVPNAAQVGSGLITGTNDPRVTSVGRILRKTHLDELPQLLNIVAGDMNFIGPRAEYLENVQRLEQKIPFYHERHMIKPGMTGWAQVRNVLTSASERDTLEKIQYDLYYLKNRSLALDIAIVIRTVKLIIKGRGTA
ncbi:MAG: exopolysaccharide biosynthesis polyprenyl glycosylphosphotransferase [Candidatus Andersenbacteria bacterium]